MNKRALKLLKELVKQQKTDYVNLSNFAEKNNVSLRTIQKDMVEVRRYCGANGIEIETVRGKGSKFVPSKDNHEMLTLEMFREEVPFFSNDTTLIRRKEILVKLLIGKEHCSISSFAESYYVSRNSIVKDLMWIEEELSHTNLILKKNHTGTKIIGEDEERLSTATSLIQELIELSKKSPDFVENIQQLFPLIDVTKLVHIIEIAEKKHGFALNELTYSGLLVHLIILMNCHNREPVTRERMKCTSKIHLFCQTIQQELNLKMDVYLSKNEILYLEQYLACVGLRTLSPKYIMEIKEQEEMRVTRFVDDFLESMTDILKIPFLEDVDLVQQLRWHCEAMFRRLEKTKKILNPLIGEIQEKYSNLSSIVFLVLQSVDSEIYQQINGEEIGFLTLYLQAAIERNGDLKKAVIVCAEGLVFSELIQARVKKYIPLLEIKATGSIRQLKDMNLTDVDFIISTSPLVYDEKPVAVISPLVNFEDIQKITKLESTQKKEERSRLLKYVDKDFVFLSLKLKTKEEVITYICKKMIKKNIATEYFLDSVLQREEKLSTELGNLLAIPHGEMEYVQQTKMAILTLENPILWNDKYVGCILLLAISQNDFTEKKEFFHELYEFIDKQNNIEKLLHSSTYEELQQVFNQ